MADAGRSPGGDAGRGFYRELAATRPELLGAIWRFNAAEPGPEALAPGVAEILRTCPRGRAALARLADPARRFWAFEEESRRLALLDPPTLEALAMHFGAAVNARALAAVVLRAERQALTAALGPGILDYALGRGAFHLGEVRGHFLARHGERPLPERVRLHGREALAACAGRWPQALRELAARRFPGLMDAAAQTPGDRAVERLTWFGLKKLLTKEVAPSWAPCFF
jgi:hypothetical protein